MRWASRRCWSRGRSASAADKILGDDELRAKYAKASLEIARKHDIAYTLDRFEEIYREVKTSPI